MKTLSRFIIFISVLLFTSCAKDIVDLTGSISGLVKDFDNGQLISNCRVSLSPGGKSVTTGADGAFGFTDLEPGQYTLSFSKAGYNDETSTVSIVASRESSVSVLLKAKAAFVLSEDVLDFGDSESSKTVRILNNSDGACSFQVSGIPTWASFSRTTGTVQGGASESINVNIDRSSIDAGDYRQLVTFSYSGQATGSTTLTLVMKKVNLTTPTVSTATAADNVSKDSFDIKGIIEATGGSTVLKYGHCWGTMENPTIDNSKTDLGSTDATSEFTSSITGLSANTTYYVRAYASNAQGTAYGAQVIVTTEKDSTPGGTEVTTTDATDIQRTTVTLNGSVDPGSETISEYGFYYGTSDNPTIRLVAGTDNKTGVFSYALTGLNEGATYYYKAYAKNSTGFVYGAIKSFTTAVSPSISNERYKIERNADKNLINCDFYSEFSSAGKTLVEAGFVTGTDTSTSKPTLEKNAEKLGCELTGDNTLHYVGTLSTGRVQTTTFRYVRPYIVFEDETFYGETRYVAVNTPWPNN